MASFSSFYRKILVDAVGCPATMMDVYLRDAARDLCQRTLVNRATLAAFASVANQGEYTLTPPTADVVIAMPLRVTFTDASGNVTDLGDPSSEDNMNALTPTWRTLLAAPTPTTWLVEHQNKIRLVAAPNASIAAAISVRVALKPSRVAATLDDTLLEHYEEEIITKAKGDILMMADKPWSNAERGHRLLAIYEQKMAVVRRAVRKSHTKAPLRVRPVSVP